MKTLADLLRWAGLRLLGAADRLREPVVEQGSCALRGAEERLLEVRQRLQSPYY